jgi:hypothetical protein
MQQHSPYHVPPTETEVTLRGAGATAVGSADTAVILWPSVTDATGAFTHTSAATTGSILTCVRPGVYSIELFAALALAGDLNVGLSLNAVGAGALTGSPADFLAADAGAGSEGIIAVGGMVAAAAADLPLCYCKRIIRIVPGDVLRFMATAAVTLDADNSRFFMERLSP